MPNAPVRPVNRNAKIKIPAVYVHELSAAPAIAGVETSAAAFLGAAVRGPLSKTALVRSFMDFEKTYGGIVDNSELGPAVRLFFANGGTQAWIARIARNERLANIRKGLKMLSQADPVNMLVIPGASSAPALKEAESWCRKRKVFFIIDAPRGADPAKMRDAAALLPQSNCAAVYYPWLFVENTSSSGKKARLTPPGGAAAGLFARVDQARGVWKSPAGKEPLKLVKALETALTDRDQELLNPRAVNCLRSIAGAGICLWGSRTLLGADGSGDEYKYVSTRRLSFYIERSVEEGIRWAVFEPNDEPLWAKVCLSVENFLLGLWRQGAFVGAKAEQAFFVKCGRGTMTAADLGRGVLNLLIGFAPLQPAEFFMLRISLARK